MRWKNKVHTNSLRSGVALISRFPGAASSRPPPAAGLWYTKAMSAAEPHTDPVLTLLGDIRDEVRDQGERLDVLEAREVVPAAPTDSTAQEIDALGRLLDHPFAAAIIGIAVLLVAVPFAKKKLDNLYKSMNGFGKKKDGSDKTIGEEMRTQTRLLIAIAEKNKIKIRDERAEDELVL